MKLIEKPFQAMKEAAGEQNTSVISDIADRLGLKPSVVYKWTQPCEDVNDSGQRGPLMILLQYLESCLILGRPRNSALAPLRFLNHRFGEISFSIPENIKAMSPDELVKGLLAAMKEAGDVIAAYQKATANNKVSKKELRDIEREVWEAVTAFLAFLYCLQEGAK